MLAVHVVILFVSSILALVFFILRMVTRFLTGITETAQFNVIKRAFYAFLALGIVYLLATWFYGLAIGEFLRYFGDSVFAIVLIGFLIALAAGFFSPLVIAIWGCIESVLRRLFSISDSALMFFVRTIDSQTGKIQSMNSIKEKSNGR